MFFFVTSSLEKNNLPIIIFYQLFKYYPLFIHLHQGSHLCNSISGILVFIYFKLFYRPLELVFIKYNFMYQFSINETYSFLLHWNMLFCWFFPAQFLSKPTLQVTLLSQQQLTDYSLYILFNPHCNSTIANNDSVLDIAAFSTCVFCLLYCLP